jgi:hypothetical protein
MEPVIGLALLLALEGCAATSATLLTNHEYPAKPTNCPLQVFRQDVPHGMNFDEIAVLVNRNSTAFNAETLASVLPDLKKMACEVGADGIVLRNTSDLGGNVVLPADRGVVTAIAIRIHH